MSKNQNKKIKSADSVGISQARVLLAQVFNLILADLRKPLSNAERRALLKVRRNGLQFVPTLIGLAKARPNLVPNGTDPEALFAALDTMQQFEAFATDFTGIHAQIDDTLRQMQSELWKKALDIYAIAERSSGDAIVAEVVSQMKAALATGPRFPRFVRVATPKPEIIVKAPAEPVISFPSTDVEGAGTTPPPASPLPVNTSSMNGSTPH